MVILSGRLLNLISYTLTDEPYHRLGSPSVGRTGDGRLTGDVLASQVNPVLIFSVSECLSYVGLGSGTYQIAQSHYSCLDNSRNIRLY